MHRGTGGPGALRKPFQPVSTEVTMSERQSRLLTRGEVCDRTGLSYSTIWRLERAGEFPARRRLSKGRVAWFAEEVERWVQERERVAAPE